MLHAHMCRVRLPVLFGAAALLAAGIPGTGFAAGYIKLGDIKGESTDKAHDKEIEILSWSWGEARSTTVGAAAGGGGAGKVSMARPANPERKGKVQADWKVEEGTKAAPEPGEAEITLKRATPSARADGLARSEPASRESGSLTVSVPQGMCQQGARYDTAELGTGERVFTMEDVEVTACAPGSSAAGDAPTESLSLNYSKISF